MEEESELIQKGLGQSGTREWNCHYRMGEGEEDVILKRTVS